ncbi:MAG TPA: hypothetical protein PLF01_01595 [Alphaproteobacteria bacterium]|nr:hypothetical protein [Alphaproteobacteria bacterium]
MSDVKTADREDGEKSDGFFQKLLSIGEIRSDVALQLFGAAILIGFMFNFNRWENENLISLAARDGHWAICWPFFQSCYDWMFMSARPDGYTQNTIFMLMLGVIFAGSYALLSRKFSLAHACIFILFLWECYVVLISYLHTSNYYYYHLTFCIIYLFLPYKRFFGSLSIVFFYFLSTAAKIHESWTLGAYFSAMKTELPLFPEGYAFIWTNILIFKEMFVAWFLFSKNKALQRSVFWFYVAFHLYSGLLVQYQYPVIVTPMLIIFFGPLYKPFKEAPHDRKSAPGWLLFAALLMSQLFSNMIPGDEKLTMEGNFYGLAMFAANHQCIVNVRDENDEVLWHIEESNARRRCDAYRYWFQSKKLFCDDTSGKKFHLLIDHSINGGPFLEIVNEKDLCSLSYNPWGRNEWIKTEDEAKPVGRPLQNAYY